MIPTLYYAIGFIFYIGYTMITFSIYSKKKEVTKVLYLFLIYFFYSVLAAYVINFVDINGNNFEKTIETLVYIVAGAVILYHQYESNIKISDDEQIDFNNKL